MRVSTSYQFETYQAAIGQAHSRYVETQAAITSGKRLNRPSDDPHGTSVTLSARSLRNGISQYQKNLQVAKGYLGFSESSLEESSRIMTRAYELAVRGASSATDQIGREAMVKEVETLQARLVELANTRGANGSYIFGGQINDSRPYAANAGALVYSGDGNDILIESAPGQTMPVTTQASTTFVDAYARLETLKNHLQGGNLGGLSGVSIPELQDSIGDLNQSRGEVGSRMRLVMEMEAQHTRRSDELESAISDREDIDVSEAILDFKLAESAYQAALQVAGQGFNLSLMDFIRG